jgi:hypothetical protein
MSDSESEPQRCLNNKELHLWNARLWWPHLPWWVGSPLTWGHCGTEHWLCGWHCAWSPSVKWSCMCFVLVHWQLWELHDFTRPLAQEVWELWCEFWKDIEWVPVAALLIRVFSALTSLELQTWILWTMWFPYVRDLVNCITMHLPSRQGNKSLSSLPPVQYCRLSLLTLYVSCSGNNQSLDAVGPYISESLLSL